MSVRTIRVFEQERLRLDGAPLAALARYGEATGFRFFSIGHRSVRFSGYVGYLQVGELGIEVLPKADRGRAGERDAGFWQEALLRLLELAGEVPLHLPSEAALAHGPARSPGELLPIFLATFLTELEALLHEGLSRGYRQVEENLGCFRGRLLISKNIRKNNAHAERFWVSCSTYDFDTPLHRVLLEALGILEALPISSGLRGRARRLRLRLPPIGPPVGRAEHGSGELTRIRLGRASARYARALALAELLILSRAPRLRAGSSELLALLFSSSLLWERAVARLVRRAAPASLAVEVQASRPFFRAEGRAPRSLRPDLLLRDRRSGEVRLVIDAKWKRPSKGPSAGDLKQAFAYNERFQSQKTILLYPATEAGEPRRSGSFFDRGHGVEAAYLQLGEAGRFSPRAMQAQLRGWIEEATCGVPAPAGELLP